MKPNYKAALLSGLLFPGLGYLSLKLYYRATVIMGLSAISLIGLIQVIFLKAQTLVNQVISGEVSQDLPSILSALDQISQMSLGWQDYAGYGLLICWLVSIVDGFRVRIPLK